MTGPVPTRPCGECSGDAVYIERRTGWRGWECAECGASLPVDEQEVPL